MSIGSAIRRCFFALAIHFSLAINVFAAVNLPVVLEKFKLSGEFRTFFFQRDFTGGGAPTHQPIAQTDQEDFAVGGKMRLETGDISGVSAGLSVYTAQGMGLNDDDKAVYNLLAKDENGNHDSYTALGEAYLLGKFGETTVQIGRQEMHTPWIDLYDIRMTPQSFQGVTVINKNIPGLQFIAAHVTKMKKRTETSFQDMSRAAGADEGKPVTEGGLIFNRIQGIELQAWDDYAHDMWNDIYLRGDVTAPVSDSVSLFGNVRYLDRRDVGDRIIGPIDTYMFGMQGGVKAYGAALSLTYAQNGKQPVLRPWGHDLAISIQVHVADRAEETAWSPCLKYDFARIGLKGLTGWVIYGIFDTPDSGPNASPDRDEVDFNVQYDCSNLRKGLNLQLRYAIINEDEAMGGEDFNDFRFYLRQPFGFYPLHSIFGNSAKATSKI